MSDDVTTLASFYRGWDAYQGLLVQALAPLSRDQLALRAAPSLRPVWVLAAHIVSARVHWYQRVMGEGDQDLMPLISWDDDGAPQQSAAELVGGLEATWRMIRDCLDRWTPAALGDPFVTPRGAARTRQWIVWHVIEHDLHHGGELCLTLGMHGLPVPDL
jgi:uncharacterized damage-inducible protein DinB